VFQFNQEFYAMPPGNKYKVLGLSLWYFIALYTLMARTPMAWSANPELMLTKLPNIQTAALEKTTENELSL
jgi:hypothetical protein